MSITQLKPTRQPTPRQLQLLKAIVNFKANQGCSPTIGELAAETGISRSTTFGHIEELRRKNLLSNCSGRARSLNLTSGAQKLLSNLGRQNPDSFPHIHDQIPLIGRVAAGLPIEAIEDKQYLSLSSHFAMDENTFALQVTGDSMIDDGICDGDYVICKSSPVAAEGQLVVAIVDEQNATLKRFYKEKKRIRLQPANSAYQPIYSDNCRIEAVVVGLMRKF